MTVPLNSLKKLTKEKLTNMVLEYQNKFDNMLSNVTTKLSILRDRFTKIELQLLVTNRENVLHMNSILGTNA